MTTSSQYQEWHFHVHDIALGKLPIGVSTTGWLVAATAGSPASPTVYSDQWGTVLTKTVNIAVVSIAGGQARFWTDKSVTSLDISWMTAEGLAGYRRAVASDGIHALHVDSTGGKLQHFVMPFVADTVAENDMGVDIAGNMLYTSAYCKVVAIDATETLLFGTLTAETGGDPNGFLDATAIGVAGVITLSQGALIGTESDGVAKSLCYTPSAGSDTGTGYLGLRYELLLG